MVRISLSTYFVLALATLSLAETPKPSATDSKPLEASTVVLPVDSPVFVYSPGNWVGDQGRGGKMFRQTWNPGAYVRITWNTASAKVSPVLLLDTSMFGAKAKPPILACDLDGIWTADLPCAAEVTVPGLKRPGNHLLTVYFKKSDQHDRWGTPGVTGTNVVRITGVKVDADSKPGKETPDKKWAMIVGDSITEGVGAYELEGYSHLVGQALRTQGYEYCLSACGWSGWLHRGDNPPGDVPGFYCITDSTNGTGGNYHDDDSRWNKIDASHSLLDSAGHFSAYGQTDQEPALILINYGTNDAIHPTNASDLQVSIRQCLPVLRRAAPQAHIILIIPFGQYRSKELKQTVAEYRQEHPDDHRVSTIDLGPAAANALTVNGYWGGLHPNARAHATFAAQITAELMAILANTSSQN